MARALAEPWPGIFYFDEKGIRHTVNQKTSIRIGTFLKNKLLE